MTDSTTDPSKPQALPELPSFRGYGALIMAAIVFLFAAYVTWGIFTMDVPESAAQPGPKFYPSILVVLSYILVALLVIDTLRKPSPGDEPRYVTPLGEYGGDARISPDTARRWSLTASVVIFIIFILILEPVGWIISAALLFAGFSIAMGHKKYLNAIAVGIVFSCAVQVAFSAGLGLNLPAGILGGIF